MWDIVWVMPQGHRSMSVSRHFLLQATQCPVPCESGSAETTVAEGGRNPVAGLWGRTLGENWPPELTSSYAWLLMSTGCKSSHSGFLDVSRSNGGLSISGWIGQLSSLLTKHYITSQWRVQLCTCTQQQLLQTQTATKLSHIPSPTSPYRLLDFSWAFVKVHISETMLYILLKLVLLRQSDDN